MWTWQRHLRRASIFYAAAIPSYSVTWVLRHSFGNSRWLWREKQLMFCRLIFFFMHVYGYFSRISAAHKHVFVDRSEGQLRDHAKNFPWNIFLKERKKQGKINPVFCAFTVIAIFWAKKHFPSLWRIRVGAGKTPLLPSKSCAYWGNPAARSQSHASFASISGRQQHMCWEAGKRKGDIHLQ